jgi:hypothetical protein
MILVIFFIFPVEMNGGVYVTCYIVILYPCNMEEHEVIEWLQHIIRQQTILGSNYDELYFGIKDLIDRMESY